MPGSSAGRLQNSGLGHFSKQGLAKQVPGNNNSLN